MEEKKTRAFGWWGIAVSICSVIAIVTFMCHFWWPLSMVSIALWGVSGAFAIFSVYGGIIERSRVEEAGTRKGRATAAAVIGCLILLGLTWSAVLILVPISLSVR